MMESGNYRLTDTTEFNLKIDQTFIETVVLESLKIQVMI